MAVAIFDGGSELLNMQLAAILNHLRGRPPGVSVINEFVNAEKKYLIMGPFLKSDCIDFTELRLCSGYFSQCLC